MPKTIVQNITFRNMNVDTLYSMFLDSKHHSGLTDGQSAEISDEEGATFSVWDGYILGRNLQLIKNKLIVQSWRGSDWEDSDTDSTFIMLFEQNGEDAVILMTHANVPDEQVEGINSGWTEYYWKPWQEYLNAM